MLQLIKCMISIHSEMVTRKCFDGNLIFLSELFKSKEITTQNNLKFQKIPLGSSGIFLVTI